MTDVISSDSSEIPDADTATTRASVVVAVTLVAGFDPEATVAAVASQSYSIEDVVLVGETSTDAGAPATSPTLEELVAGLGSEIDYVWILHGDAEPRPDALAALVREAERHEASLVGSKRLVAGTRDTLEGVGSATDVFGEPYTGLDEGEVDLEQYDVVRDVAFVSSVSTLVRRDLLRGLRGLDPYLPPNAAGLDLSQRVRIAGGRVMVVPSSEVFHHRRCGKGDGGWREQAGRMRAMLKAYKPITLLWMIPFAVVIGLLDSLGSLLLGRWRLIPRYGFTWLWNLMRLPSTAASRRGISRVRQVGDEELFRYQVKGSVRLRTVGSELSDKILGIFDEDRVLTRRATEVWSSSATWAALAAVAAVVIGVRAVVLGPLPVVGHALSFGEAGASLGRFLGGWNSAGLGSDAAVHPATGIVAIVQAILFDQAQLARSVVTVGAFVGGVFGLGHLSARLRLSGVGGYLGGIVAMFGPVAAILAGQGRWAGLIGIGLLPWALSAMVGPPATTRRSRLGAVGRAAVTVGLTSFFVPWLAPVPLLFALVLRGMGRFPGRPVRALLALPAALVAVPYLLSRSVLEGVPLQSDVGLVAVVALAVAVLVGMVSGTWRVSALAGMMLFGGVTASRATGPDLQVALLAVAAVGSGLAVAAAIRRRPSRNLWDWLAIAGGVAVVLVSTTGLAGGRAGLPTDQWGEGLAFMTIEPVGVERALLIAPTPERLPGDSRPGPGFWYRTIDSEGPTLDQAKLAPPGPGDEALGQVIESIVAGSTLRPGQQLADFGIRWVVAVEESAVELASELSAQVDLEPLPLSEGLVVFENTVVRPVAVSESGQPWERDGSRFFGAAEPGRVRLAIQGDGRWGPDWQAEGWAGTVAGAEGEASFSGDQLNRLLAAAGLALVLAGLVLAVWGRGGET